MTLRVGIIGLGVGEAHIEGYKKANCQIRSLCDFDAIKLKSMAQKYPNTILTTRAEDLFKDPSLDIISIASFDNYHFEHMMQAIKYKKHVFIEKPLCLRLKELQVIEKALAKNKTLKISSNLILRKSPLFEWLNEAIQKKKLGQLNLFEADYNYGRLHKITHGWRGQIPLYSVVLGGGIHLIDLIQWMTKDVPQEAFAYGNRIATRQTSYKYNDIVCALIHYKSGMVAKVSSNYSCIYPHFHKISLYGTKATFLNDLGGARWVESRESTALPKSIVKKYPGVKKGDLIPDFIQAIRENGEPCVSKRDISLTMRTCLAIEQSIQTKKPVRIKSNV